MDSMEELEVLDQPRGIVAKANRYAAEKVPIEEYIRIAKTNEQMKPIIAAAQVIYEQHFDAFIAGAHAALELSSKDGKA